MQPLHPLFDHAPSTPALPQPAPLWRLAFRPFYLGASLYAALSVALWALQYTGILPVRLFAGSLGHAYEMLFGFACAVIAGFLLTAGRNWTNQPMPTGRALAALFALWVAGRVVSFLPITPWVAALVNAAFPLAVAVGLGRALLAARNQRNYFFIALLVMAAVAALLVYLAVAGVITVAPWLGIRVGLDLVLFIMAVMGGRVIPMFTSNGVRGVRARRLPWLERLALGAVLALLAADMVGINSVVLAAILAVAAVAHTARLALWQPWRTLKTPIVWILHAGYVWIPVYFVLRMLGEVGLVPLPVATHALTAGAIGGLTIAMMTRTARGHTGRPLIADRWDIASYALVLGAALVRVVAPLLAPSLIITWVLLSGLLWSVGYAVFFGAYLPRLTAPRVDGRPG